MATHSPFDKLRVTFLTCPSMREPADVSHPELVEGCACRRVSASRHSGCVVISRYSMIREPSKTSSSSRASSETLYTAAGPESTVARAARGAHAVVPNIGVADLRNLRLCACACAVPYLASSRAAN